MDQVSLKSGKQVVNFGQKAVPSSRFFSKIVKKYS
jgi:hypothetical protein